MKMNTVIKIDKFGRFLLPIEMRRDFNTDEFVATKENNKIVLNPVPTWEEMMGSIKRIDTKKFLKEKKEQW